MNILSYVRIVSIDYVNWYNLTMQKKLILVFVVTFVISFLFWPEFKYDIGCRIQSSESGDRCQWIKIVDYSEWRLHGGLTLLQWENKDKNTSEARFAFLGEPKQYQTNTFVMIAGSIATAATLSYLSSRFLLRRNQ